MSEQIIGGNGGETKPEEPKVVEMKIVLEVGKPMVVHFLALNDKIATYGFLKMAEKTLDEHYRQLQQQKVIPVKGSMLNFARRKN